MRKLFPSWMLLATATGIAVVSGFATRLSVAEDTNAIESFAIDKDFGLMVVPVSIGKEKHKFLVDTGAASNVFDASLEQALQRTRYITINGGVKYNLYYSPTATVGASLLPLEGLAMSRDLSQLRNFTGEEIVGIVGMPFLKKRVLRIDGDGGYFQLLQSAKDSAGEELKLSFDAFGRPIINVALPGRAAGPFLIDTGVGNHWDGQLTPDMIDSLLKSRDFTLERIPASSVSISGVHRKRQGRIKQLTIGTTSHENLAFQESDLSALGMGYLSRFRVTFDFENQKLFLEGAKGLRRRLSLERVAAP